MDELPFEQREDEEIRRPSSDTSAIDVFEGSTCHGAAPIGAATELEMTKITICGRAFTLNKRSHARPQTSGLKKLVRNKERRPFQ